MRERCGWNEQGRKRVPGPASGLEGADLRGNLKRKTPTEVEQGLARILAELSTLGLPVARIHTDSGTEFVNPLMRKMVTKHQLLQTCSAPEEHNSNGRVENVVQRLKSQMRAYLHMEGSSMCHWPLAARAAAAVWRTRTLRAMVMPIPSVVAYGTKVQVLSRTWLRRNQQGAWTMRAKAATVLCPAALVKAGYVVRVGKQLSVVTKLFDGQDSPVTAVLSQDGAIPPTAHSMGPERRVRRKTSLPDMSVVPPPTTRIRKKSRGPGRIPVVGKLTDPA